MVSAYFGSHLQMTLELNLPNLSSDCSTNANRDKLMNPLQEIKNWVGVLFPPKLEDDVEI
jgi:hypothetical protein